MQLLPVSCLQLHVAEVRGAFFAETHNGLIVCSNWVIVGVSFVHVRGDEKSWYSTHAWTLSRMQKSASIQHDSSNTWPAFSLLVILIAPIDDTYITHLIEESLAKAFITFNVPWTAISITSLCDLNKHCTSYMSSTQYKDCVYKISLMKLMLI